MRVNGVLSIFGIVRACHKSFGDDEPKSTASARTSRRSMARACFPQLDDEALQLFCGEAEAAAGTGDHKGPTKLTDETSRPEANETDVPCRR